MACPCEDCGDHRLFGCTYCCQEEVGECAHIHPVTGKCGDPLECPAPCETSAGLAAHAEITFPAVAELSSAGEGSWMKPPGGPKFWANVDGGNDAPSDDGEGLVEVPLSTFFGSADEVAIEFDNALEANGWSATGTAAVRSVVREEIGAMTPPAASGPFSFAEVFLGLDPGESPCQVPEVALPFDGYRPAVDDNDDDTDDYQACMADAAELHAAELDACATAHDEGTYARCECDEDANLAAAERRENCHVDMVPRWLTQIQAERIEGRAGCCRGAYPTCIAPCEQEYFDAVAGGEAGYAADERDAVVPYAAWAVPCSTESTENPSGSKSPTPGERYLARACIVAARDNAHAAARETRANCTADCRYEEMVRRGNCSARRKQREAKCASAFQRSYDDAATCLGHNAAVVESAFITLTECRHQACAELAPGVPNEHQRAECDWAAWKTYAQASLACCFGLEACIQDCVGLGIIGAVECLQECSATAESCGSGLVTTYLGARALCQEDFPFSDCPNCFSPPGLPSTGGFECGDIFTYSFTCALHDPETGLCPDGCQEDTSGVCGDEANPGCACEDPDCPTGRTISCGGQECFFSYTGCVLDGESTCPGFLSETPTPVCRVQF